MKKQSVAAICFFALLAAVHVETASADTCSKPIISTTLEAGNFFEVDVGVGAKWQMCRLDENFPVHNAPYGSYSVTPLACQALVAQMMSAQSQHMQITFYFDNACPTGAIDNDHYPYAIVFQ